MEVAFDVYQWAQTIKWPSCKEPLKGDCGITFLELLANFLLVTGKTIPVTIKRLGTRITWAPFNSEQAYIQPQRAKSAMAQAVVLDSIIQQLNRIFNMAIFPMPKRIGIKSLSHFGHCTLQKRTGYVCRPELKHTKETIFLVNAFLNDCRDNQNYNLSMRVSSYFKTPPVPICMSLQNPATVITPEQVIYRRNKLYGRRRKGQWQHCLQRFICGIRRSFSIYSDFFRWALDIWRHIFGHWGGRHLRYTGMKLYRPTWAHLGVHLFRLSFRVISCSHQSSRDRLSWQGPTGDAMGWKR